MRAPRSADIFCEVIDNYGDAGVGWRLARALSRMGLRVTLWMDDLPRLQRLRPGIDVGQDEQMLDGFALRRWPAVPAPDGDLVISAFGCRLPDATLLSMASRERPPVWINLEYLSAEPWVEGSHRMPSPHPRLPLVQHFFFPGFTARTGGLLREADVIAARDAFDRAARDDFLRSLAIAVPDQAALVSLFCYPSAPLEALFAAMSDGPPVVCVVPEGVTPLAPAAGECRTLGALTLHGLRFLQPDDYDRLLWSCDLNFVRGEDSASRAQWSGQPFLWQLYPQQQRAHLDKLHAFLSLYTATLDAGTATLLRQCALAWNGATDGDIGGGVDWTSLHAALPDLKAHGRAWRRQLEDAGELASSLVEFAREIG
jgi:uncharacterized repeat protein (TIGR03837 family)